MKEFKGVFEYIPKKCPLKLGTIANGGTAMLYLPKRND